LIGALIAAMDDHARATRNGLAQTEVVEKVYDALDYCLSVRKMVHIAGLPRFGKSESLTAWCNARPGIARVVVVPPSNSEGELYIAVAEALGIDAGAAAKLSDLRTRIEYVLKHSRLMLCIDESHYLFPTKFTKNTTPARLNWVRSILDKRTPVALCFTPQSFNQARRSFTQATGYAVEQFSGRVVRTVTLPDVLSKKDLFAVAKHHFPEFDNDFLLIVVSAARRCEGYLQAVEAIAGLARHYATKRGSAKISAADLKLAISEIAPANADGDSSRSTAKENSEPSEPLRLAKKPPEKIISLQPAELSTSAPRGACVQLTPDRAAELEQAEA
jgi:hypothetical protein